MHAKLVKQALFSSLYLRNNLLNMYAKCSHLPDALKLFDEMTHKNVVSWTAVIVGFIQKGHPVEALSLCSDACTPPVNQAFVENYMKIMKL
ncbi:hypothetical protein RJ640_010531 [Escallonia rubra]|uniref:Pentatricopeptide repeat-containing protein n=1 Tax=Escallonia rubra TaxID=112253 RepID=A0AA88U446_9ASTE|nr:hypothetical protein RJ640_010531 [Escallonia rubra]